MLDSSLRNARGFCHAASPNRLVVPHVWRGVESLGTRDTVCHATTSVTADRADVKMRQTYVSVEARRALFSPGVEQVQEVQAAVQGQIPAWLEGSALLNGGGDYTGMKHLFDGYAMISKLRVEGGKVFGSQRFVDTKAHSHFASTGKMRWREFGTPIPASTPIEQAAAIAENVGAIMFKQDAFTDNASVNMVPLGDGSVLAISESRLSQYRMDPTTLETLAQAKFPDAVPGDLNTAHPKVLPDGTLVNFTRTLPFGGFHVYLQDPTTLQRRQIAFIPDRNPSAPSWVHDMSLSSRHLIICETPLYFNMPALLVGSSTDYVFLDWAPQDGTLVHVVALDGSGVQTFDAPTFFTFHYANAFEDPATGDLHVDMAVYDSPDILNDLALDPLRAYPGREVSRSYLRRLTIPLRSAAKSFLKPERLAAPQPLMQDESANGNFVEFPDFNPKHKGKSYRYCWGMAAQRPTNMGNAIAKFDIQTGTSTIWHEEGATPGGPIFVPSPSAATEDDGVIIAAVTSAKGSSFMLVLDACTMRELARAALPFAIPYRFHGTFISAV